MNRMFQVNVFFILAILVVAAVDSERSGAQDKKTKIDMKWMGQILKIGVQTKHKSEKIQYQGKIVSITDKTIVLNNVTKIGTNERGVPMLGDLPYVSRLFRNVGVAREKVKGKLTVKHSDIIGVEILKTKKINRHGLIPSENLERKHR